jgi:hypothetical protein
MRKTILLLSIFFSSVKLFAQSSLVSVFSEDGEKFWVVINGIKQNDKPQTNVKVTGLEQENYLFKIIFEDDKIASISKDVFTTDVEGKATNCTYVLRKNKKGEMQMKINSYEPLDKKDAGEKVEGQAVVEYHKDEKTTNDAIGVNMPGMEFNMNVSDEIQDGNQKESGVEKTQVKGTKKSKTERTRSEGVGVNVQFNDPVSNEKVGINMNLNVHSDEHDGLHSENEGSSETKDSYTTKTKVYEKKSQAIPAKTGEKSNSKGCISPVSGSDFSNIKSNLGKQAFEETRLKMLKDIMKRNCFNSAQIKEIMEQFSFEKNKLEVAKYGFDFCTDKNNYYILNEGFSFSSSVDELSNYLEGK